MRLYELAGAYAVVAQRLDAGEDVGDVLAQLDDAIEKKSAALVHVLRNVEADIQALDDEIKRLTARRKTAQNSRERIRDYVRACMEDAGASQLKAGTFSIALSDGAESVVVEDEALVPDAYVRIKREIDKTAVLRAYRDHGEIVPGTRIERGTRLCIR